MPEGRKHPISHWGPEYIEILLAFVPVPMAFACPVRKRCLVDVYKNKKSKVLHVSHMFMYHQEINSNLDQADPEG